MRFLVGFILLFVVGSSYGQGWGWAKTSTCNNGWGNDLGMIAYDNKSVSPGMYAVGVIWGDSICLGTTTIHNTAFNLSSTFVIKYDTSGNVLWAIGSRNGECFPKNITTDCEGNLLIVGILYEDSVSFGTHTLVNPDFIPGGGYNVNHCMFLLKIDPAGHVLLLKYCGTGIGVYENLITGGISLDAVNNIYISGTFHDSVLKIGSHIFPNTHKDSGDIFLLKLDPMGDYMWAKTFGDTACDYGQRLLIGSNNRLYLTGWFASDHLTFGSITLHYTGSMTGYFRPQIFLVELDTAGNPIWAKCAYNNTLPSGLAIDSANNIYLGGSYYEDTISFGSYSFRDSMLAWGGFIMKFDTFGNVIWGRSFYPLTYASSGSTAMRIYDVTVDPCGNIWASGSLRRDSIGFEGAVLIHTPPTGGDPMILVGLDSAGSILQWQTLTSGGEDNAGIASDCKGNIYIAGDLQGSYVKIGSDTVRSYTGGENMFLAKYRTGLSCIGVCSGTGTCNGGGEVLSVQKLGGEQIYLFPNPANTECTITCNGILPPNATIAIYDLTGRLQCTYPLTGTSTTISITNLPPGMYVCRINAGDGVVSRKLVIMR
ncbi:MAG: hypothetical protein K0Q79_1189 [Flavipsychrobacter sp.]|jgi:hypothetical protein|nr:hypothetical protein [Flavipsychrobacter sp.]